MAQRPSTAEVSATTEPVSALRTSGFGAGLSLGSMLGLPFEMRHHEPDGVE
jgi:hypothetical protein